MKIGNYVIMDHDLILINDKSNEIQSPFAFPLFLITSSGSSIRPVSMSSNILSISSAVSREIMPPEMYQDSINLCSGFNTVVV